ncbi:MAG TPA: VWA domain-containing protein [Terriglobales bacterium]|nr:VWA domain-containing protein [Terriglobales bacterium]
MKFHVPTLFLLGALAAGSAAAQDSKPAPLPEAPSSVKQQPAAPAAGLEPAAAPAPTAAPAAASAAPPAPKTETGAGAAPASPPADNPKPAPATPTQKPAAQDDTGYTVTTIKKRVDEVNVVFTVTDKHGHFVKDLKQDDIEVFDDHKPPQAVVYFKAETDLPLRVGLLIDTSTSIRSRFKFEQESAIEFLNQTVRPKTDKAFVLGFDTERALTADFTDSSESLSHGVRVLRPGGGTALYDAVYWACRDKLGKTGEPYAVRKAIVLVSDGDDNFSHVTREEAVEMAQRAEVIIYAISTNIMGMKGPGDRNLERLAESTGGRVFFPMRLEEVADYFQAVQEELRSQYMVDYKPADFVPNGRFRSIQIEARNKKLHVRARQGYYAPLP